MARRRIPIGVALLILLVLAPAATAGEPFRYPAAKHGKGELRYLNGLPVLTVEGSPEELGDQIGFLALKPTKDLTQQVQELLKAWHLEKAYPVLMTTAAFLGPRFPPDHLKELEAAARVSGIDRNLLIFVNTLFDMQKLWGCSALLVEPERSATSSPLFGRNLDIPPFGHVYEYSFVTIYRPRGKHAFASITLPGLFGCASGMNEHGLAIAWLDVSSVRDGSPAFDPMGTPLVCCFRRVLEECGTVEEAEKLIHSLKRTRAANLAVCDRKGAAVLEITPKNVVVRRGSEGICSCTNHFRSSLLAENLQCPRYEALERSRTLAKLTLADVAKHLHAANQGSATLQTMIFEPATLKVHLAFGKGPASALPLQTLELAPLFSAPRAEDH
ncbi:MAG TPA: C45 family peptidase [Gemmataceae bacterium]|nr:C45 family peptidase [Gemmataceae bacterium]